MSDVHFLVNKCHVSMTNREVIKFIISKIKGKYKGWRALPRDRRKYIMRAAIQYHRENFEVYAIVMGGTTGRGSSRWR